MASQNSRIVRRQGSDAPQLSPWRQKELQRIKVEMHSILGEAESVEPFPEMALRQDWEAIDDERAFIKRFGFDWPRKDRIALIELKRETGLTDREIRLMKWSGSLRRTPFGIKLAASRGFSVLGKILIVLLLAEFSLLLFPHAAHAASSGVLIVKLICVVGIVVAAVWGMYLGYIRPWQIQRRIAADRKEIT